MLEKNIPTNANNALFRMHRLLQPRESNNVISPHVPPRLAMMETPKPTPKKEIRSPHPLQESHQKNRLVPDDEIRADIQHTDQPEPETPSEGTAKFLAGIVQHQEDAPHPLASLLEEAVKHGGIVPEDIAAEKLGEETIEKDIIPGVITTDHKKRIVVVQPFIENPKVIEPLQQELQEQEEKQLEQARTHPQEITLFTKDTAHETETPPVFNKLQVLFDVATKRDSILPPPFHPDDPVIQAAQEGTVLSQLSKKETEEMLARATNISEEVLEQPAKNQEPSKNLYDELLNNDEYPLLD